MKSINPIECFLGLLPAIAIIFLMPVIANAEQRVVVKEYTYKASDIDSKISSKAIALEQVKRLVLEEVGSLVSVKTEVVNYQLESDQIKSITAGIVGIKVLDETWDGESYYIKAQATVNDDNIAKDINALLQNQNQVAEIESVNKKVDELLGEIEKLKAEIKSLPDQSDQKQEYLASYDDSIKQLRSMELVQDSYVSINSGNYETAMSSLSGAYAISPFAVAPMVYIARSIVYARQNKYQQALNNLDRSLRLNPSIAHRVALNRAYVYERSGNKEKALNEINKAILSSPRFAPAYHQRAYVYKQQGSLEKARENKVIAVKIQREERQQIVNVETKRQQVVKEIKGKGETIRLVQDGRREQERPQKASMQEKRQEKIRQREARQQLTRSQQQARAQQYQGGQQQARSQQQQARQQQQQRKQEARQQQARSPQQQIRNEARQNQPATQQVKQQRQQRKQEAKQQHQGQESKK